MPEQLLFPGLSLESRTRWLRRCERCRWDFEPALDEPHAKRCHVCRGTPHRPRLQRRSPPTVSVELLVVQEWAGGNEARRRDAMPHYRRTGESRACGACHGAARDTFGRPCRRCDDGVWWLFERHDFPGDPP